MTTEVIEKYKQLALDTNAITFSEVRAEIYSELQKRAHINRFVDSDTMSFIIDTITTYIVLSHYNISMAWSEGNLQTARLNTSIRNIIKTLGVRFKRKTPAQITVNLTRSVNPAITDDVANRIKTRKICYSKI